MSMVVQKVEELRAAVVHHATEGEREMFAISDEGLGRDSRSVVNRWRRGRNNLRLPASQKAKQVVKKALRKTA
jgi:hypothetical protein